MDAEDEQRGLQASIAERSSPRCKRSLIALDGLNFFLADVQTGVGPFLAIYLAGKSWNERDVGLALMVGGVAGIVTQTPLGALVDAVRAKRALGAMGVGALVAGLLVLAFVPRFWPVLLGQMLVGGISSLFIPLVCAISLGLVGRGAFDARQGRNQAFNAAGNVFAALLMGGSAYAFGNRAIFFLVVALAVPTLLALRAIDPADLDHERARGADAAASHEPIRLGALLQRRGLFVFLVCAVLFHFANAAMLPLLGEQLARGRGRGSMLFMSACVIVTQLVVAALSPYWASTAARWGRKPVLLLGFGVLPVRGVLYTLTQNGALLVGIQLLDGVGAGIFGVASVLAIADLTQGTGRFNLALGTISCAVGIGASLSQFIAGGLAHRFGFTRAFEFLALVALAAFLTLLLGMPETRVRAELR